MSTFIILIISLIVIFLILISLSRYSDSITGGLFDDVVDAFLSFLDEAFGGVIGVDWGDFLAGVFIGVRQFIFAFRSSSRIFYNSTLQLFAPILIAIFVTFVVVWETVNFFPFGSIPILENVIEVFTNFFPMATVLRCILIISLNFTQIISIKYKTNLKYNAIKNFESIDLSKFDDLIKKIDLSKDIIVVNDYYLELNTKLDETIEEISLNFISNLKNNSIKSENLKTDYDSIKILIDLCDNESTKTKFELEFSDLVKSYSENLRSEFNNIAKAINESSMTQSEIDEITKLLTPSLEFYKQANIDFDAKDYLSAISNLIDFKKNISTALDNIKNNN